MYLTCLALPVKGAPEHPQSRTFMICTPPCLSNIISWPFTSTRLDEGMLWNKPISKGDLQGYSFRVSWVVSQVTRSTQVAIDSNDKLILAGIDVQVFVLVLSLVLCVATFAYAYAGGWCMDMGGAREEDEIPVEVSQSANHNHMQRWSSGALQQCPNLVVLPVLHGIHR